jgi:hypothetical protein
MSLESDIFDAIKSLTSNRCYPDKAPQNPTPSYTVFQQVGGQALNYLESAAVGKRNARIQIACWATTRIAANALARSVEDAMVASSLKAYVLSAFTADFDEETKLFGARQEFSIWY